MVDNKKFLTDVGISDLPFPMRVTSKADSEGQFTIANISIAARIMQEFEARWIDKFIQIVHDHRDRIGTETLRANILDYLKDLKATMVKIDFDYPFFVEKETPVSRKKCLVRYLCTYSVKALSPDADPKIIFKMEVPCITTYPGSVPEKPGGLFGQLSVVHIELVSNQDVYPEDLVDLVDKQALSPVYSFLTEEDQVFLIQKIHSETRASVVTTDRIRESLVRDHDVEWAEVRTANFGMLHSYSTVISTEKSRWVPFSGYQEEI